MFKEKSPGTPVIVITAFGDWPTYLETYDKGADDYVSKPFKMADLKNAIGKALKHEGEQ